MFGKIKQRTHDHQEKGTTRNKINAANNVTVKRTRIRSALLVAPMLLGLWLGMVGTSYAECVQGGIECKDVYIEKLMFNSLGNIYIGTTGTESALSCNPSTPFPSSEDRAIKLSDNHPNKKEIYSMLLTAKISEKLVSMYTYASGSCSIEHIVFE